MVLEVVDTVAVTIALYIFEVWILATFIVLVSMPLNLLVALSWGECPLGDVELAAAHPWRYHYAYASFWFQKIALAFVILGVTFSLISAAWHRWPSFAYWIIFYPIAVLLSLQFFPNDANSLTPICAVSYRLQGPQPNLGRRSAQSGTVGRVYLEPIHVTKHRW